VLTVKCSKESRLRSYHISFQFVVGMGPSSSKTHFAGIITNLLTSDIAGDDYDFWDDLWKVTLTTEEIFELISVEGNYITRMN